MRCREPHRRVRGSPSPPQGVRGEVPSISLAHRGGKGARERGARKGKTTKQVHRQIRFARHNGNTVPDPPRCAAYSRSPRLHGEPRPAAMHNRRRQPSLVRCGSGRGHQRRAAQAHATLTGRRRTGKAEALDKTLQREWAYARLYRSNAERLAALPQEYNGDRPHNALGGLPALARICQ
jgi:hypothetical protein